jgi:tyrosyl-tRNA synthetase
MHEMLYPVMQGIDSAILAKIYGSCDLEIGGTDQTFNMLMGRDVMRVYGQPEQSVMSMDILEGLDGKEKMIMMVTTNPFYMSG